MPVNLQRPSQSLLAFAIFWTGQAFSLLGSGLVSFALVWYLTETTGSATVLALASLVSFLPQVLLGPIAGTLVDRWNRRTILILSDGLVALATVALALLFTLDIVRVWHIYSLNFIRALGGAFHFPASRASIAMLVPDRHLARVQGMDQMLFGLMKVFSPAVGALLLSVWPMQSILAIDVSTALLAILSLSFVSIPQPDFNIEGEKGEKRSPRPSVLDDLQEGLRFVWAWSGLRMIISISVVVYLLLVPAFSLLPILVTDHFGGGAPQLAWLQAAYGIGTIAGGLLVSTWGGFRRRVVTMMLAIFLEGLGFMIIGSAPGDRLLLAGAAMFFSAAMESMSIASIIAILQTAVPPELHGRVFAVDVAIVTAAAPIGLAVAGPFSDIVGVRPWFVAGGLVTALLAVSSFFSPTIMEIERNVV